ncbi:hypothetical protein A6B34_01050 [Mycolicibacterium monacense]|uniref:Uncharacterized protein n=1 Tax=Mycolicibacterium doricum TaxID=126673 RepID=A0A1X1TGG3_9MYCO|nr:hypothetical protein [Mycolicibacterium monacense DSM 44395]OBB74416.1 hypothetical protein A6B34_01050 [Mycolicibacterium monacense]OBF53965.1 hypothetical protein A5778_11330 [Mycolicibacterium monacense]ORV43652.1 hypothetical protein AWC01_05460 [Mycolicibacterium doricum]
MIVIAMGVVQWRSGWGRGSFRRRRLAARHAHRRLAARHAHRRRDDRLWTTAIVAICMLGTRPTITTLLRLGASAVVVTIRSLGGRPMVTTGCACWTVITVPQT